jgi:argininosuccinate synthase
VEQDGSRIRVTNRIVLAYSGSRCSSIAIGRLAQTHSAEVVTLTLDLGQGGDLEEVRDSALAAGAVRAHVLDAREELAKNYLLRALKAGALYDRGRSAAPLLARPLIAQKLVEIAGIEQTDIVAHASGDPEDRIAAAVRTLNPSLSVLTSATGADQSAAPRASGQATARRTAAECPAEPAYVEISIHRGVPAAVNGVVMPLVDLVGSVDILAGAHGVGRLDGLETPGAFVVNAAHERLQALTFDSDVVPVFDIVTGEYRSVLERGSWFTPLRSALDAFVDSVEANVSGVVRLKLFTGGCEIVDARAGDLRLEIDEHSVVRPLRFHA